MTTNDDATGVPERLAYTVREACQLLGGLPYKSVLEAVRTGEIASIKRGRHYLIPRKVLDDYLDGAQQKTA